MVPYVCMGKRKYRDSEWLKQEYYDKERSITSIAEELGVDHTTISKWRRKLEVPKPTSKVILECPVCGDNYTRHKSKVKRAKHASVCSRECHYKGREMGIIKREVNGGYDTSPEIIERECAECADMFGTTRSQDYKYCSRDCFLDAHSKDMAGENNPAYKDGSASEKRCNRGPHWARIRKKVYERDNYTCQRCGGDCISRRDYNGSNGDMIIQAHHIDAYDTPKDNQLNNLVTLCASCHAEVEGGADLNVD